MQNNVINITTVQKKKWVRKMCVILEKMRNKAPEQLLLEYDIPLTPPIDLKQLVKKIGITEIAFDFSKIEEVSNKPKGSICGAIYANGDNLGIFYKSDDTMNRQRFTIAHEIAHCCLDTDSLKQRHLEYRNTTTQTDPKEIRANIFAGELLIPESIIRSIHKRIYVAPRLSDLANLFQVSIPVMTARLENLGLTYIKDEGFGNVEI